MSDSSADRLFDAVLAARGDAGEGGVATADLSLARMLIAARTLDDRDEELCPARARHRAHGLFEQLPEGVWEAVARLVFDSWQQLAPAARSLGTERLMVYESGVGSIDLQLGESADGDGVDLILAVQGGGDGVEARVELDGGPGTLVHLDDHGTGSLQVSSGYQEAVVIVKDADGELLRTPAVPLR